VSGFRSWCKKTKRVAGRLSSGKNDRPESVGDMLELSRGLSRDIFGTRSEFDFFGGRIRGFYVINFIPKVLLLLAI
jgi:hypothetical protein